MRKRPIIFCDFDGTFVEKDIGYNLFRHFSGGKNLKLVEDWKKGLISSRDCILREAAMFNASLDEVHAFLADFKLSSGAREFYETVSEQNIPFYIVSDGMDIYIEYVLDNHSLKNMKYFCNKGAIRDRRLSLEFPFDNSGCERCGCCKGARISDLVGTSRPDWEVIFIGDGLSDICAVPHADILFARGDLLKYCQSQNVTAIEYGDFFDILDCLKKSGRVSGSG